MVAHVARSALGRAPLKGLVLVDESRRAGSFTSSKTGGYVAWVPVAHRRERMRHKAYDELLQTRFDVCWRLTGVHRKRTQLRANLRRAFSRYIVNRM
jgi:hypothetical protein